MARSLALVATALALAACGSASPATSGGAGDASASASADGAQRPPADAQGPDASDDASLSVDAHESDANAAPAVDASPIDPDRFVTGVVSFDPGECAGFGEASMPRVVEGPPVGGGSGEGSTDVVSLGGGGAIVVTFAPNAIVDGPGPDFIVFENPFWIGGNSNDEYAEPGEVSVSDDGSTWSTFPCTPGVTAQTPYGTGVAAPYGSCAGWHVVWSNPANGISPVDPSVAGGDAFDLADLGVTHARYVRIVDKTLEVCPDAGGANDNGFDLDAIAIVHAELP